MSVKRQFVARILTILQGFAMKRRAFLRVLAAAGAGTAVGGVSWGLHERLQVAVTRETLRVAGLPSAFAGFKIAMLTDVHRSGLVPEALVADAVALAMRDTPDLVVLGGDYVTNFDARFAGPVAEILGTLSAPAGVVAVLGNHDDERVVPAALSRRGIKVLREDRLRLAMGGAAVDFIGISYWTKGASKIAPLVDPAALPVLVAHDPRRLTEAEGLNIPLVLSGHTHGGQIVVPPFGPVNQFRFPTVAGTLQRDRTLLFVSRGIGTIYLPLRINCPPEVAILTLA
jgi:predicted MPP superfamily phosphohydrolase